MCSSRPICVKHIGFVYHRSFNSPGGLMERRKHKIQCASLVIITGLLVGQIQAIDKKDVAIGGFIACGLAVASASVYGHVFLPWYTNKKELAAKKRHLEQVRLEQEEWRELYRTISNSYNAANIPLSNSCALFEYKNRLDEDICILEKALNFTWEDLSEREVVVKLIQHLKEHQAQVTKLLGATVGQETYAIFKEELNNLAHDPKLDPTRISTIVYEKFGDTAYKFTNYKQALNEAIARCKQFGAPCDVVTALEDLNKATNFLFATSLDQERSTMQAVDREDKILKAQLDERYEAKKFFQDAQRHVQQSTQTVNDIGRQVDKLHGMMENCLNSTNSLINLVTSWGYRNSQQYDNLASEIREERKTTRDVLRTMSTKETKMFEQKLEAVERKAQAAQVQAKDAQQKAKVAQDTADAALSPLPPAYNPEYLASLDPNNPSAPPASK